MFLTHDKYIETADEVLDRFNDRRIDQVEGMRLLEDLNHHRNEWNNNVADEVAISDGNIVTRKIEAEIYEGETDGA